MARALTNIVLYGSPICLTVALGIFAFGINAVGRGFGSSKTSAPIVIAAIIVWLLHAGYVLGPWFYHNQRHALALWLMVPIAVVGITTALLIANQLIPADRSNENTKFYLWCALWTAAVLFGYVAPIIFMLIGKATKEA